MPRNHFASDLLIELFNNLNNCTLKYALLRNYELLPQINDSKDVDIVVDPNSFNEVIKILIQTSKKNGYKIIWKNELDYLAGFVFVKIRDNDIYYIKLDIFKGFKWRGLSYLNHDILFNNSLTYNGFRILSPGEKAFQMILYYILYAKSIKIKYIDEIYNDATKYLKDFKSIAENTLNKKTVEKIIIYIKGNKIHEIVNIRKLIIRDIFFKSVFSKSLTKNITQHFYTELFKRYKFGTLIVISGPDGAGKSTILEDLMKLLFSIGITDNIIPHHFLTKNIPSLHKLPGVPKKYANQDYTKPYHAKTAGFISSIFRFGYYYFAFLFDRYLFIKKELKKNNVVIFDRYYIDMMIDPSRFRIGLSKYFVKKILFSLPKPNFTFIVLSDKQNILERKNELDERKLDELIKEYNALASIFPNCQIINNSETIDRGKLKLLHYVFSNLEKFYS